MSKYNEKDYSISNALKNIGETFWNRYRDDLKAYADDRSRTDIIDKIHEQWDGPLSMNPYGTDIRIEWALAIYDHGDWDKSVSAAVPSYTDSPIASQIKIDPRRRYPADYRCDNGIYVRSISELCIANWLYHHRIPFEYEKQVIFPNNRGTAHCDFYLPEKKIYIEYWGMVSDPAYNSYKQWKEPLYKQSGFNMVSLYPDDLKNLGDRLNILLSK